MALKFSLKDFPPEKKARTIAEQVLGRPIVGLRGPHLLTAVEFYVTGPDFCDQANHCHPLQLQHSVWYVHTSKNHVSFKAPRYSGLDLACGNEREGVHAGMLIRQLDFDGGSGLAIMKLLRGPRAKTGNLPAGDPRLRWTPRELKLLSELQGADAFRGPLRLDLRATPLKGEIVAKRRIGISGKDKADLLLHFSLKPRP